MKSLADYRPKTAAAHDDIAALKAALAVATEHRHNGSYNRALDCVQACVAHIGDHGHHQKALNPAHVQTAHGAAALAGELRKMHETLEAFEAIHAELVRLEAE